MDIEKKSSNLTIKNRSPALEQTKHWLMLPHTLTVVAQASLQQLTGAASDDSRDPMLVAFEAYLLKHMRQSDLQRDEEGVLLFNVNQVAYLVEGSNTDNTKKVTRRRVNSALDASAIAVVMQAPSFPGKGKTNNFGGKSLFDRPDSRGLGWSNSILAGKVNLSVCLSVSEAI